MEDVEGGEEDVADSSDFDDDVMEEDEKEDESEAERFPNNNLLIVARGLCIMFSFGL